MTDINVDTCPEWNCPDLSSQDRREGKVCPDHPCHCVTIHPYGGAVMPTAKERARVREHLANRRAGEGDR